MVIYLTDELWPTGKLTLMFYNLAPVVFCPSTFESSSQLKQYSIMVAHVSHYDYKDRIKLGFVMIFYFYMVVVLGTVVK